MPELLHQFITEQARNRAQRTALVYREQTIDYGQLHSAIADTAAGLQALGVEAGDRVAVYLPKQPETVYSLFGAVAAGGCFLPVNPLLKARQVAHVLADSGARVLITSKQRLQQLKRIMVDCPALETIIVTDMRENIPDETLGQAVISFTEAFPPGRIPQAVPRKGEDMAAILYTSGSTGNPSGVMLSHNNLILGAQSVAGYLENSPDDRLLAALPLSFDAGLGQLTTAFSVGASVALMEYLVPRDIIHAVQKFRITGLGAVPPLWIRLAALEWPASTRAQLRYITSTGGVMPVPTSNALRQRLPNTRIYLMYGLTEAFRSTYLAPEQLPARPDSIGKAIPNAEVLVVDEQGDECAPGEPGELVHRGPLVAMGYWNNAERTAQRFRACPKFVEGVSEGELAVWSGDRVRRDKDGYLYFLGRMDEMIKTSGYLVSPTEIEEEARRCSSSIEAAVLGLPHPELGEAILLVVAPLEPGMNTDALESSLRAHCRRELPNFMQPRAILLRQSLPLNQNGKIDRAALKREYRRLFEENTW